MEAVNVQMMQLELAKLRSETGEDFDMCVKQSGLRVDEIVTRLDIVIPKKFGAA